MRCIFLMMGLSFIFISHAALPIIATLGQTMAITQPVLLPAALTETMADINIDTVLANNTVPSKYTLSSLAPITSHLLSPGEVNNQTVNLPWLRQPLFLVGADEQSKNWLQQYGQRLIALKAIGLLVQARDQTDINSISALVPGLIILPMSGDAFAKALHLEHYPVLISAKVIEQ